jgi:hypothetical protein
MPPAMPLHAMPPAMPLPSPSRLLFAFLYLALVPYVALVLPHSLAVHLQKTNLQMKI